MIYSTVNNHRGGWAGLKKSKHDDVILEWPLRWYIRTLYRHACGHVACMYVVCIELDIFWTISGQVYKDYLVFIWILDLQILSLFASLQLRQLFYSCLLCELVDALCWCRYRSFGQHFNNAIQVLNHKMCWSWWGGLWQYRLWRFQGSDTELEKFFS